jgi:hypothetical protein
MAPLFLQFNFAASLLFTLYPAIEGSDGTIFDIFYQARITGGISNTGFTLYCLFSIIMVTAYFDRNISILRATTIILMSVILMIYPSRQVQLATALILIIIFVRKGLNEIKINKINIILLTAITFLFIGLYLDVIFNLIELSIDRTIKNLIIQEENYSRIIQYKIALQMFSENILFGGGVDPNIVLENHGVDVFESSISDVAVRYGLLGVLLVFFAILILLQNRKDRYHMLLLMPIFMFLLFNEVIYEEIFWFTIIYISSSRVLLSRNLNLPQLDQNSKYKDLK